MQFKCFGGGTALNVGLIVTVCVGSDARDSGYPTANPLWELTGLAQGLQSGGTVCAICNMGMYMQYGNVYAICNMVAFVIRNMHAWIGKGSNCIFDVICNIYSPSGT